MANRFRGLNEALRMWQRMAIEMGDELRAARLILGLTQRSVGEAIGVSASEVSRRELGKSTRLTGDNLPCTPLRLG